MIIDDHSRMIVGGGIFFNDNALNYQKVLKDAIASYGIPDKILMDNGGPYRNGQLKFILGNLAIHESHARVRDGASKGKVERNFRTLRSRWLSTLDASKIHSLEQFNEMLKEIIRIQIDNDITKAEKYVNDNFVWTDEMQLIGEKLQKVSKELNGRLENELADKLLAEN